MLQNVNSSQAPHMVVSGDGDEGQRYSPEQWRRAAPHLACCSPTSCQSACRSSRRADPTSPAETHHDTKERKRTKKVEAGFTFWCHIITTLFQSTLHVEKIWNSIIIVSIFLPTEARLAWKSWNLERIPDLINKVGSCRGVNNANSHENDSTLYTLQRYCSNHVCSK